MSPKQAEAKAATLQKVRDLCRLQHKSYKTEKPYLYQIGLYIDWLAKHGRDLADSRSRMQSYLTVVAHRGVSRATQAAVFNALLFLYEQVRGEKIGEIRALRPRQRKRKRQALTKPVTLELLKRIPNVGGYPTNLICQMLYGLGMRVSEPLNLRVKDFDETNSRILIIGAKGGKDRWMKLPCWMAAELVKQKKRARAVFEADQAAGIPLEVPGLLAVKYPRAPFSWQWAWMFPQHLPCRHPRTGEIVRYHMHEANVQRAVKIVAKDMDLETLATPHVFRHCCATHLIEAGNHIHDVKEFLGHSNVETTMIYVRPQSERILSPLENPISYH